MSLFHAGICFSQSLRYRCCWIQCKHSTSMGSSFSGLSENSACNRTLRPAYRHPVVIPGQSEQVIWVRAPQTLGKEQCILVEPLEGLSTVAVARSLGTVCRDRVPIEVRNRNHFFLYYCTRLWGLCYILYWKRWHSGTFWNYFWAKQARYCWSWCPPTTNWASNAPDIEVMTQGNSNLSTEEQDKLRCLLESKRSWRCWLNQNTILSLI